jgi:hypothetical protein
VFLERLVVQTLVGSVVDNLDELLTVASIIIHKEVSNA